MAKIVSIPPAGFEDLTPEEKVQYVQDLWDYVVADVPKVLVPDWHVASSMSAWPNTRPLHTETSRWPKSLSVQQHCPSTLLQRNEFEKLVLVLINSILDPNNQEALLTTLLPDGV